MENGASGPLGPFAVQLVEQVSKQKHVIARILSMEVKPVKENTIKTSVATWNVVKVVSSFSQPDSKIIKTFFCLSTSFFYLKAKYYHSTLRHEPV